MYDFKGKNILIVGASSGIGEKTASVLVDSGARVVLVARREDKMKCICDEIGREKSSYYVADFSKIDDIKGIIDSIVREKGKIDGLVYAAGIGELMPIKQMTYDKMLEIFNINFFGFIETVRNVSARKNHNNGLRIVAISSVASVRGQKANTIYSASKAAIDASVRCLAKELWDKGIVLNTVQPSMIRTQMYEEFLKTCGEDSDGNQQLLKMQYAGIGETTDVANAIAFLLSPEARYITGTSLPVDGGYTSS
ncbi:SDR family NAD(P)-dependent oxidoreductase [Butyrivibrio proteoclasticus]|uniref:SDR family NAD(P)-dependent oxidoreductase n=1 Tax=Butyrivibrio proteoclasticus TaxID=43305 RepID=UPI000B261D1E|nr:SDR family oxidoreductase [Butyrivibrio proteoclasticus]